MGHLLVMVRVDTYSQGSEFRREGQSSSHRRLVGGPSGGGDQAASAPERNGRIPATSDAGLRSGFLAALPFSPSHAQGLFAGTRTRQRDVASSRASPRTPPICSRCALLWALPFGRGPQRQARMCCLVNTFQGLNY